MPAARTPSLYDKMKSANSNTARPSTSKKKPSSSSPRTDIILSIAEKYMGEMVRGEKTFEFRTVRYAATVRRVWFYTTAPVSTIKYVCEVAAPRTRKPGDAPLPEGPNGNKEFNEFHKDWDRHDYAYEILSVYELEEPIPLHAMKSVHGMKAAPQSMVYVPESMRNSVVLDKQMKLR